MQFDIRHAGIKQVCADGALYQSAPECSICLSFFVGITGVHRHERSIENIKLWAGAPAAVLLTCILLKPCQEAGIRQQIQIMRQSCGIAGILQLSLHFGVRENLSRVVTTKLKGAFKQCRLVHAGHRKDVSLDIWFDE